MGLAEQTLGKDWENLPFSAVNQEKMMDKMMLNESSTLKNAGLPITEAGIYMVHFIGTNPEVLKKLQTAPDNTPMKEILTEGQRNANPIISELTVGEYRKRLVVSDSKREGFNFVPLELKDGELVSSKSIENKDLKTSPGNTVIMDNTQTNMFMNGNQGTPPVFSSPRRPDLPIQQQG